MDEWLSRITDGVDLSAPDASWLLFLNMMRLVPWAALTWLTLLFIAVGALLGWWRGRLWEGVVWAAVLGPFGWVAILLRPRRQRPPPLPRRRP